VVCVWPGPDCLDFTRTRALLTLIAFWGRHGGLPLRLLVFYSRSRRGNPLWLPCVSTAPAGMIAVLGDTIWRFRNVGSSSTMPQTSANTDADSRRPGAGTGACPYGCWFSIREAVGATPCGCPRRPHGWWFAFGQVPRLFGFRTDPRGICAAGQAQGPAPTVLMGPYSPWSTGISNRTATTASLPRARRKTRWTRRSESLPKRRWWRATLRLGQLDHFPVRVPCTCLRCGILSGKLRFTQDDGTWHRSVAKKVSPVPCQL